MRLALLVGAALLGLFIAADLEAHGAVPKNLPSHARTPGYGNPEVRQANIQTTICVKGWTATIRPPYAYTSWLKKAQIRYWKLSGTSADYEEDHFIPLELGGSPYDTRNLWPESWAGANASDSLENQLHIEVCNGTLTLAQGRKQIKDWKYQNG